MKERSKETGIDLYTEIEDLLSAGQGDTSSDGS